MTFAGIKLRGIGSHLGTKIYVVTDQDSSRWYSVTLRPDEQGAYPTWDPTSQYVIPSYERVQNEGQVSEAILGISDGEEEDGCIRIRHLSRAHVEVIDGGNLQSLAMPFLEGEADFTGGEGFNGQYPVWGTWLKRNQEWCVL